MGIRPTWLGGAPPAPPPAEPTPAAPSTDAEALAIFLACGTNVADPPLNRIELLSDWNDLKSGVRAAYRRRAARLLKAWKS